MPGVKKSTAKSSAAAKKVATPESNTTPVEEVKSTKKVSAKATAKTTSPTKEEVKSSTPVEETTSTKKVSAKKSSPPPSPPPQEEEVIEVCTEETCKPADDVEEVTDVETRDVEEVEEIEEEEVEEYEEQEEEEEIEEDNEEEDVEEEEGYLADRNVSSVPITSVTSPRHIARQSVGNRQLSPRVGDVRSPKRPSNDPRIAKKDVQKYGELDPDDLLYSEEDIRTVVLPNYANVRTADVITFLVAVDRCPYVFRSSGVIVKEENADSASVIQYVDEIDEAFEIFECIQGILAFMPVNDIDFGYNEEMAHHLSSVPDKVYIAPIISSGPDAGDIRFVDDLELWGLIGLDDYYKIRDRPDYRSYVKKMPMEPLTSEEDE